jgi:squalene cyclase
MDWDGVETAIGKAVGFIISTHDPDGLWRDFETLAGSSSDWVSGFVLRALSISHNPGDVSARAVSSLTSRQRQNGGWSYNRVVPTDCDSTSWVLLAISPSFHQGASPIQKGVQYLWKHQDRTSGGFATYCPWDRVHEFIGVTSLDVMSGWFSPHICVTGVAVQSLLEMGAPASDEGIQKAAIYITAERNARGLWDSYWWKGYAYGTYQALKALSLCKALTAEIAENAANSLLSDQRYDGGWNDWSGIESEVFGTAFALSSLLLLQNDRALPSVERGMQWLVGQQRSDGSFPTAPMLKIPPPMVKDPAAVRRWRKDGMGTGVMIEDKRRIFTTSAALQVLSLFKGAVGT